MKETNRPHGLNISMELHGVFSYYYVKEKVDYEEY